MRIIEFNPRDLARAVEEHNRPCTCLVCSLHKAAWIERVDCDVDEENQTHHFTVEHSYPQGINIRKWVADTITACAPEGAKWTLKMKRVAPQKSGR